MTFPNFITKYDSPAVFNPADSESYRAKFQNNFGEKPPDAAVLCYDRRFPRYIMETYPESHCIRAWYGSNMYIIERGCIRIGVVTGFGFGAPITVSVMEQLISLGVQDFLNIGIAGTLQRHIDIGDVVICDKAIRDEGTSWHYVKASKYADATPGTIKRLTDSLLNHDLRFFTGTSWTTDAPYRETVDEVKHFQSEGVLTVDMEASALYVLGGYRNVDIGSVFVISDSLADLDWKPAFQAEKLETNLFRIFEIGLDVLSYKKSR